MSEETSLTKASSKSSLLETIGGLFTPRRNSFGDLRETLTPPWAKGNVSPKTMRRQSSMYHINPHTVIDDRVVIAMVGLPARGKSYLSKAIVRYLTFLGCPVRVFNAGNKRRDEGKAGAGAAFFDASNAQAHEAKERMAMETLDELLVWLQSVNGGMGGGCACGIFDATNTTRERREKVVRRVAQEQPRVRLLFVESLCDDEELLQRNYRMKLANDDYKNQADTDAALADFLERVRQYEKVYQPITDEEVELLAAKRIYLPAEPGLLSPRSGGEALAAIEGSPRSSMQEAEGEEAVAAAATVDGGGAGASGSGETTALEKLAEAHGAVVPAAGRSASHGKAERLRYIQIINAGKKLVAANCSGFLFSKLLSLLHSIHLGPRTLWLVLVGQTINDNAGCLGGDTALSPEGLKYAKAAAAVIAEREMSDDLKVDGAPPRAALVLTGTLRRYTQHAEYLARESVDHRRRLKSGEVGLRSGEVGLSTAQHATINAAEAAGKRVVLKLQMLNELCAGKLDSLSYDCMKKDHPEEYAARLRDKLNYRYPGVGGESYADLIMRLQESILSLEQQRGNTILVCDRAVARVILGYFQGTKTADLPFLEVFAGVTELRRTHSGFKTSHLEVKAGATTTAAGPGTSAPLQHDNAQK